MTARRLRTGQTARIHVHDVRTGADSVVHESADILFEAPNWSPSGRHLLLNGDGELWSLALASGRRGSAPVPIRVPIDGLPEINNDHVPHPRGGAIFLSAADGHIHRAEIAEAGDRVVAQGSARRVTAEDALHFLHGVSPDGNRLAVVRMPRGGGAGRLALMPASGGESTVVDTGPGHIDGPEWTPDGESILLNSERWATRLGHAQIARVRESDGAVERLIASDTVDWFPHVSPDGTRAVYLEYPPGTEGHPEDLPVTLVVVDVRDWTAPLERIPLHGGQGTVNVNSWAPDSARFAYVSYPPVA